MEEKSRAQELSVREISLIRELAQILKGLNGFMLGNLLLHKVISQK